jgi:Flp pilus assembly protein TadG
MALITPVFLSLVFGIMEYGRAMMLSNVIANVAREAARSGVLDGSTNAAVTSTAQTSMKNTFGLAASDVGVTIQTTPGAGNPDPGNDLSKCQSGDLISINVQVTYDKVAIVTPKFLAGKAFIGKCTMRHE